MHLSTPVRVGLLIVVLLAEVAAVVAFRTLGWYETGSAIQWFACLVAAILPLAIAAALLFRDRLRFSLRALLTAMALVAIFLVVSGVPLRNALAERRISRRLVDVGAVLHFESANADFLEKLGYPRRVSNSRHLRDELPGWLRPLAGDAMHVPRHVDVQEIWFNSDQQITEFCRAPDVFVNLECIVLAGSVTTAGLQMLGEALPRLPEFSQLGLNQIPLSPNWLRGLHQVRLLYLESPSSAWRNKRPIPSSVTHTLSDQHFAAIAALPNLKVLHVVGHYVSDADVAPMTDSGSLEHVFFKFTPLTPLSLKRLDEAMPNCEVRRNDPPSRH